MLTITDFWFGGAAKPPAKATKQPSRTVTQPAEQPRKLSELEAAKIKGMLHHGYTNRTIARQFGVSQTLVQKIRAGQLWKNAEMKFLMDAAPLERVPEVGDVYRAKGGVGGRAFWVVVAKGGRSLHCLGLDEQGNIISTGSYADHAMQARERVGVVADLAAGLVQLNVQWEPCI